MVSDFPFLFPIRKLVEFFLWQHADPPDKTKHLDYPKALPGAWDHVRKQADLLLTGAAAELFKIYLESKPRITQIKLRYTALSQRSLEISRTPDVRRVIDSLVIKNRPSKEIVPYAATLSFNKYTRYDINQYCYFWWNFNKRDGWLPEYLLPFANFILQHDTLKRHYGDLMEVSLGNLSRYETVLSLGLNPHPEDLRQQSYHELCQCYLQLVKARQANDQPRYSEWLRNVKILIACLREMGFDFEEVDSFDELKIPEIKQ